MLMICYYYYVLFTFKPTTMYCFFANNIFSSCFRYGSRSCMQTYCRVLSHDVQVKVAHQRANFSNGATIDNHYTHAQSLSTANKQLTLTHCDISFHSILRYHVSSRRFEDAKSIADKTVQILSDKKRKAEEKQKWATQHTDPDTVETVPAEVIEDTKEKSSEVQATSDKPKPLHIRAWRRTVKEVKHYYHGFRLLFIDVKICTRYIWGVLNGKTLSRRERKQVRRQFLFCIQLIDLHSIRGFIICL